ncbi:GntR family transcriptional regulator [Brachybacterium huguangmaarense]
MTASENGAGASLGGAPAASPIPGAPDAPAAEAAPATHALTGICRIDRHAAEPPVRQICEQVARAVQDGALAPGTRLPTVRALAADLDVAVNTVAKAFRRLEEARIVITRGRAGTVVAPLDGVAGRLEQSAREFADLALQLGVDRERARRMVLAALDSRA